MNRPFLTAEWRQLAMVNFEVDPGVLTPFIPAGTQLDSWQSKHLVSVVGFLFLNTRIRGVRIPLHSDFEEVNLRFYVRRRVADRWRRGVVFVRELVPRMAVAAAARLIYNERYRSVRMGHALGSRDGAETVAYWWIFGGRRSELCVTATGDSLAIAPGSEQEFIVEHEWGYAKQRDGGTVEYRVEHPRWTAKPVSESRLDADVGALYGQSFQPFLRGSPSSAFLAAGSEVAVFPGASLRRGGLS